MKKCIIIIIPICIDSKVKFGQFTSEITFDFVSGNAIVSLPGNSNCTLFLKLVLENQYETVLNIFK